MRWLRHPSIVGAFITGFFSIAAALVLYREPDSTGQQVPRTMPNEERPVERTIKASANESADPGPGGSSVGTREIRLSSATTDTELRSLLLGTWSYKDTYPNGTLLEIEVTYESTGNFYQWSRIGSRLVSLSGTWSVSRGKLEGVVLSSTDSDWVEEGFSFSDQVIDVSRRTHVVLNTLTKKEEVYLRLK